MIDFLKKQQVRIRGQQLFLYAWKAVLEPRTKFPHLLYLVVAICKNIVIEHLELQLIAGPAFYTNLLAFFGELGHYLVLVEDAIRFAAAELSLIRYVLGIFTVLDLDCFVDIVWLRACWR